MLRPAVLLVAALLAAPWANAGAASLHVEPGATVLEGEPIKLSVTGAVPGSRVTLRAERWRAGPRARWMRSEAVYEADAAGRVELDTTPALQGTYQGVDPRGLFWSMLPVAAGEGSARQPGDPKAVRIELQAGAASSALLLQLLPHRPEVQTRAAAGLPGARFAILPGPRKRPAVILLGGSEGGSSIAEAAAPLASHGFAVLALPVFSPPGRNGEREIPELPAAWAELPVETLNQARDWLARQPDVDATRIALQGTSMGALLALLGGVHLPWVSGVVASVPSDVVWDGWGPGVELGTRSTFSVRGVPLPFLPLVGYEEELRGFERNEPVILRRAFERGRAARPDLAAKARVPVERITAPVMVIGSHDDQMWPSGAMAQAIAERRIEAGLPTEALIFQDAGHLLYDTGYAPTTPYNTGLRKTGGTPQATARAQALAWPRTIRFLQRTLGVEPP